MSSVNDFKSLGFSGEDYSAPLMPQRDFGVELMGKIKPRGNERVLDIGSGDGMLTNMLSALVPAGKVVGVDPSPKMISYAEARKAENITFVCQSFHEFLDTGKFDIIFSNASLHYIASFEECIRKIYSLLVKDGRAFLNFGCYGNIKGASTAISTVMAHDNFKEHFETFSRPWYFHSASTVVEALETLPNTEFSAKFYTHTRVFGPNEHRSWLFYAVLPPFVSHLPDTLKGEFQSAVEDKFLKSCGNSISEVFRRVQVLIRCIG